MYGKLSDDAHRVERHLPWRVNGAFRAHLLIPLLLMAACRNVAPAPSPTEPAPQPATPTSPAPPPVVVRDTQLEQKLARTELRLLEREAQVDELQIRLDDARREVVRAMAKLQSLATRAEAASGMAEAEIALRALRTNSGAQGVQEVSQLMELSTAEFNKQNYGGALYLANQAKGAATAAQGRLASVERESLRAGEVSFALPLQLQTTGRANVRDGPGGDFNILFTLPTDTPLTAHSYADQWLRITDDAGRRGWIYQGLISRRP